MAKNSPALKAQTMYKVVMRFKGGTVHSWGPYSRIGDAKNTVTRKKADMNEWNLSCALPFVQSADFEIYATEVDWVLCDQEESS